MKYDVILWDFNGTLLNDVQLAVDCVNDAMRDFNCNTTDIDEYVEMFEPDLSKYYAKLVDLNEHPMSEIFAHYQSSYKQRIDTAFVSNDILFVLDYCKSKGIVQHIVSSFVQDKLNDYAKYFRIDKYFDCISGHSDTHCGSKTERAKEIIKRLPKFNYLLIGDTANDYDTAAQLGIDCILYSKGHQKRSDLEKLISTKECNVTVVDNIKDVISIIK